MIKNRYNFESMEFIPDYNNLLQVLNNEKPDRLPLYEHHIDAPFISKVLGQDLSPVGLTFSELKEYYGIILQFWRDMTYDGFDFEAAVCDILPGHGAIFGGMDGPIQTREDFNNYPWEEIPHLFWKAYTPHFEAIKINMQKGMKAYGGCGYGIFEASQDLVGYENLCLMQCLDPDLFADLFNRIGDVWVELWRGVIEKYSDMYVFLGWVMILDTKHQRSLPRISYANIFFPNTKKSLIWFMNQERNFSFTHVVRFSL